MAGDAAQSWYGGTNVGFGYQPGGHRGSEVAHGRALSDDVGDDDRFSHECRLDLAFVGIVGSDRNDQRARHDGTEVGHEVEQAGQPRPGGHAGIERLHDAVDAEAGLLVGAAKGQLLAFGLGPAGAVLYRMAEFASRYWTFKSKALGEPANDKLMRSVGGPEAVRRMIREKNLGAIRFYNGERSLQSRIAGLAWSQSYSVGRAFYQARNALPFAVRKAAFERYIEDPYDGAAPGAIVDAPLVLLVDERIGHDARDGGHRRLADDREVHHHPDGEGIPPPGLELRHELEIHAVDADDEGQREEDR